MDAVELFSPLGPTYDRYATLLSFGQDPRWRRFLVSRVEGKRVLDVACGTGAVTEELVRRGHEVVGLDQNEGMLAVARRRGRTAAVRRRRVRRADLHVSIALRRRPARDAARARAGRRARRDDRDAG